MRVAVLTTKGYDRNVGIQPFQSENGKIWKFRVPSDWVNQDIYMFLLLFFFRVKKRDRNHDYTTANYWIYSDDRASGHKACYYFAKHLMEIIEAVYIAIAENITRISQLADDKLCNGYFKSLCKREHRMITRDKTCDYIHNKEEKKLLLPKVTDKDLDNILSTVFDQINSEKGIKCIRKAFDSKLEPNKYDKRLKDHLEHYEKIKNKPKKELFPDKINYYNNIAKRDTEFKDIPEALLHYKHPKRAYYCRCGWALSGWDFDRIAKHNLRCKYHSDYGIVPAFEPNDPTDSAAYIAEFDGYKQRLNAGKCMFRLEDRWIEYTDDIGNDIMCKIIQDRGKGYVMTEDTQKRKRINILRELQYHGTPRIWRNF